MIWFTGDPHFWHINSIKHSNRPFSTVEEMNDKIIENFNKVVGSKDIVYFMGDVAYGDGGKVINALERLNKCQWFLLLGNHDKHSIKNEKFCSYFEWIKDYHLLKYNGNKYVLCHYPFHSWDGSNHGSVCIHSHCHNKLNNTGLLRFDVGVDCWNYSPVSIETIDELAAETKMAIDR